MKSLPHEYYMSLAVKEAHRALYEDEIPIGAVIIAQDQIVGKGYNQTEKLKDVTAHAEILAITAASNYFQSKYLKGCTIYVTIEPCMMCASAIGWAQMDQLIFGASDPKKGFTLFDPSPLHPKTKVEYGILDEECGRTIERVLQEEKIVDSTLPLTMPNLYIIAGCNGAGKTTASFTILPEMLDCREFVNADEIARGLSPFQPEKVAIAAGRLMLERIQELISLKEDFAFETTLSTRSFVGLINEARKKDYRVKMVFVCLRSSDLAIERVTLRVSEGGHHIPADVIERRYYRGIKNFFELYMSVCDSWMVVDNSLESTRLVAEGENNFEKTIHNHELWNQFLTRQHEEGN